MRQPDRAEDDAKRDDSPSVFVPALHAYHKASKLPAFRDRRLEVLRCADPVCGGDSLLKITEQNEDDPRAGRLLAGRHNVAVTEQIARRVLSAARFRGRRVSQCR